MKSATPKSDPAPARSSDPGNFYARIGGKLGARRVTSDRDLTSLVEARLPSKAIEWLLRGGLSDAEVYQLVLPRRTLAHRIARGERLSTVESDKVVRIARIAALAEEVFTESVRAWRWLRKPKRTFDGRSPLEMLATEAGARLVEEMLVRIDDGIAA